MASRVSFAAVAVYRAPCGTRLGPRTARGGSHDPATATAAQAHAVGENGEIIDPENEPSDAISTAVVATGWFQIYLGAVAGVGKTITMLGGGRHRLERGRDVVFGFVKTRGRVRTAQEIGTLEVGPHKRVQYRGTTFWEMDLEAILARRPEIALADELAHTNVPNSGRNEKRWQDVIEPANAGIAVESTGKIQHRTSKCARTQSGGSCSSFGELHPRPLSAMDRQPDLPHWRLTKTDVLGAVWPSACPDRGMRRSVPKRRHSR